MYVCMYVRMYECMYVCMNVCMYCIFSDDLGVYFLHMPCVFGHLCNYLIYFCVCNHSSVCYCANVRLWVQ